jgi:alginate O-acetyltransferase complex protein AlgF
MTLAKKEMVSMFRTHNPLRLVGACLALSLAAVPAHAQLYAREAPPGSTFVHVFNATPATGVTVQIGEKAQPPLLPYTATPYIFLPPGQHAVQAGAHKETFALEGNHYYTVVANADGLKLFEFHEPLTRLKAMIGLFNLMPGTTLSLKTADGATAVFDAVAPNTSVQRTINPLKLSFALFSGDRKIADVPATPMDRGQSFSLFACGTETTPVLVWNKD